MDDLEEQVRSLAEPVLARHGADLVRVEVRRGPTTLVRVVADQPTGIDLDTCARVSNELSRMLDVEDPIPERYTLEVTSPGLDRPLRTEAEFRRYLGHPVRVILASEQIEGTIDAVDATVLQVGERRVELADIVKATLILPW